MVRIEMCKPRKISHSVLNTKQFENLYFHPGHSQAFPDYTNEQGPSKYMYCSAFAWLNDSTLAMTRLVFSGVFELYPDLKVIIHHFGAMIPSFVGRLDVGISFFEKMAGRKYDAKVKPPYSEHFKKFYVDTAMTWYNPDALQVALNFFGPDHMMFGSDLPMDAEEGVIMSTSAEKSVSDMKITEEQMKQIFCGNAERILRLA